METLTEDDKMPGNGILMDKIKQSPSDETERMEEGKHVEEDPWALPEVTVDYVAWSELSAAGKARRVLWDYLGKTLLLLGCLYFFVCALDLLSDAFRLLGGKTAGSVLKSSSVLRNPVAGLMVGVLATVLLQSSSTTTGIVISLVVTKVLEVGDVIPIVMGANIGTSVTNTIVAMGQIPSRDDFRRAFAGATVHDMFNWAAVIVLLPLEVATGYLYKLTELIISSIEFPKDAEKKKSLQFLKTITKPFTKLIIKVDKGVLREIAKGNDAARHQSVVKRCCKYQLVPANTATLLLPGHTGNTSQFIFGQTGNTTLLLPEHTQNATPLMANANVSNEPPKLCVKRCEFLFDSVPWSDTTIGVLLLFMSLLLLSACFVTIVKTLYSVLRGQILSLIKKFINANFPGRLAFLTDYVAIMIGTGITMVVQSSSVVTSALTPLVGIGIISIERMYPLTLGANLGTTFTAVIIALSQSADDMPIALQVALCHMLFNLSGIVLFYPLSCTRIPIKMAKFLGNQTAKYRWFGILYMVVMFVLVPLAIFGLSSVSWVPLAAVLGPVALVVVFVLLVNLLRDKKPDVLPRRLRSWHFLPRPLRSLQPYDNAGRKVVAACCTCCNKDSNTNIEKPATDT